MTLLPAGREGAPGLWRAPRATKKGEGKLKVFFSEARSGTNSTWEPLASVAEKGGELAMAQKANLTPVDKYEPDRREAERLDLEKHARLEAGLTDPVTAVRPAPTSKHQHREGLSFWQAVKTMFR
jgi:hypothetical protein